MVFGKIKRWWDEAQEKQEQRRQAEAEVRERRRREEAAAKERARQAAEEQRRQRLERHRGIMEVIREGRVPNLQFNVSLPFNLQKSEHILYVATATAYAEMKIKREVVGRTRASRVRVMKGVSFTVPGNPGERIEANVITPGGTGLFAVSTKHIHFDGNRTFRIRLDKIVAAQSARGGVEIVRDRASGLPEYFSIHQDDIDFVLDLIHTVPETDFRTGVTSDVQSSVKATKGGARRCLVTIGVGSLSL